MNRKTLFFSLQEVKLALPAVAAKGTLGAGLQRGIDLVSGSRPAGRLFLHFWRPHDAAAGIHGCAPND
jgi:hypothetical protein